MALALQDLAPAPGQTSPTVSASQAAPARGPAPESTLGSIVSAAPLFLLLPLIAMMFWTSRSQQKKQQKALAELKKGDTILTQSGLRGKLVEMGDRFAKVEIAPGTKVDILRSTVLGKDSAEVEAKLEKR